MHCLRRAVHTTCAVIELVEYQMPMPDNYMHVRAGRCLSWNSMGPTPTPTRTSSRAAARAEVVPRSACHEPDTHDDPRRLVRRLVRHARFSSRGCPLGMRACTRVRVLYMISYSVYTFTKLHDRRILKVRVGVGPMEFQL